MLGSSFYGGGGGGGGVSLFALQFRGNKKTTRLKCFFLTYFRPTYFAFFSFFFFFLFFLLRSSGIHVP